jgi:hypothetical protein
MDCDCPVCGDSFATDRALRLHITKYPNQSCSKKNGTPSARSSPPLQLLSSPGSPSPTCMKRRDKNRKHRIRRRLRRDPGHHSPAVLDSPVIYVPRKTLPNLQSLPKTPTKKEEDTQDFRTENNDEGGIVDTHSDTHSDADPEEDNNVPRNGSTGPPPSTIRSTLRHAMSLLKNEYPDANHEILEQYKKLQEEGYTTISLTPEQQASLKLAIILRNSNIPLIMHDNIIRWAKEDLNNVSIHNIPSRAKLINKLAQRFDDRCVPERKLVEFSTGLRKRKQTVDEQPRKRKKNLSPGTSNGRKRHTWYNTTCPRKKGE